MHTRNNPVVFLRYSLLFRSSLKALKNVKWRSEQSVFKWCFFRAEIARRFAEIESNGITRSITAPLSLLE